MESIKELREICQKQKMTDKNFPLAYGYLFHRRISIYITRFFLASFPSITPSAIGALMICLSLAGAAGIAFGVSAMAEVAGIALVYFGFLLDKVDGEIARYKKVFPLRGMYLDEIYHAVVPAALVFAFLRQSPSASVLNSYMLVLAVYFVLLNRYGRKIWLILFAKNEKKLEENSIEPYEGNGFVKSFFNILPFRALGILERFDLIIFSVFLAVLAENIYILPNLRIYYLYSFLALNVIYFVRWFFLNYFGGIDKAVKDIAEKGY